MNNSGNAYKTFTKHFKVNPEHTIVVFDSFHMPFGALRLRAKGSNGGHNGIGHILQVVGHDRVPQLRIGIGPAPVPLPRSFALSLITLSIAFSRRAAVMRIMSSRDGLLKSAQ